MNTVITLPDEVSFIIGRIEENGYEAYAVGGCVRDSLRGAVPSDWDVCTSAKPDKVKEIFAGFHLIDTGLRHGTVTLMLNHVGYEITTFRVDGEYSDRRKPDCVSFVTELREDVRRRDFTINSMAYSARRGLKDYFGGRTDLKNGVIRCVGDAAERFGEDALRILRAMRFAASFNFAIAPDTAKAMHEKKELLDCISKERIASELMKLLRGDGAARILNEFRDIVALIIPELEPEFGFKQNNIHHDSDVWEHTLRTVAAVRSDEVLRLTMLFHDSGKPHCYSEDEKGGHFYGHAAISADIAENVTRRLKMSNEIINSVKTLVLYHDSLHSLKRKGLMRLLNKIGMENTELLFEVTRADAAGHSAASAGESLDRLEAVRAELDKIKEEDKCFKLSELNINGNDLIALGVKPGKKIGFILNKLMEMVMDDSLPNNPIELTACAKRIIEEVI